MNPDESQQPHAQARAENRMVSSIIIAILAVICFCHPPFILILALGWILRLYGFLPD